MREARATSPASRSGRAVLSRRSRAPRGPSRARTWDRRRRRSLPTAAASWSPRRTQINSTCTPWTRTAWRAGPPPLPPLAVRRSGSPSAFATSCSCRKPQVRPRPTSWSGAVLTHQGAPCWAVVTNDGRIGFTGNGAGSVSAFAIAPDGAINLVDANGGTALIGAGINDIALSHNSRYLYVLQTGGAQAIHAFRIQADGHLTALGAIAGLPNGTRGLAAF